MSMTHLPVAERPLVTATGDTYVDVSAGVYTGWLPLLTVAPSGSLAAYDVFVAIDLDKATTGFAATQTTQTAQFAVARKIDGTNWRRDLASITAALAGDNADTQYHGFVIGEVGPNEDVRIEVILSAENGDIVFPYLVQYRGGPVTVTAVTP